jgi:hypothetical protein
VKPLAQQNFYEILDVPFDAPQAVIAEAVERAQALYAPGSLATYTLMDPEEEQLLLRLLSEARTTLLDPAARARYDERITGPDEAGPPVPSPASPALEATIRAAWPELPQVVPAAPPPADEDWDEVPTETPARAAPSVQGPPVIPAAREPEPPPPAPPAQRSPILLSREVAPVDPVAAQAPAAPPAAGAAPAPAPTAPTPPAAGALPPMATLTPPPPTAAPGEGTTWSGEVLRQIREARGISLQQISERTKVTRHHIENIEADRFDVLPAAVYLRGILLSIARELRLDGQKVARSYLERVTAANAPAPSPPRPR